MVQEHKAATACQFEPQPATEWDLVRQQAANHHWNKPKGSAVLAKAKVKIVVVVIVIVAVVVVPVVPVVVLLVEVVVVLAVLALVVVIYHTRVVGWQ